MKSRINISNKGKRQKFEAKTVIKNSSLKTRCVLCLQRLSFKQTEVYLKMTKLKNPNLIYIYYKTNIFKSHKRLRIKTKSN